jgi:hypothetical protein
MLVQLKLCMYTVHYRVCKVIVANASEVGKVAWVWSVLSAMCRGKASRQNHAEDPPDCRTGARCRWIWAEMVCSLGDRARANRGRSGGRSGCDSLPNGKALSVVAKAYCTTRCKSCVLLTLAPRGDTAGQWCIPSSSPVPGRVTLPVRLFVSVPLSHTHAKDTGTLPRAAHINDDDNDGFEVGIARGQPAGQWPAPASAAREFSCKRSKRTSGEVWVPAWLCRCAARHSRSQEEGASDHGSLRRVPETQV